MKYSFPKKNYKKGKKSLKVRTAPKTTSSVVKLQKQFDALNSQINKEKETKWIDLAILQNSVSQVNGNGPGVAPTNAYGVGQLSNSIYGLTIAPGTGPNQRIGNFINLKRMKWRCQIQNQIACISPMKLRFEIWQLLGDPTGVLMSPQNLVSQVYLPNNFYLVAQGSLVPPLFPAEIYDTTCLKNPLYKMSNVAKKIFTKKISIPPEQFNQAIEIREVNFNVDLKNMKSGFVPVTNQLQSQYYYFIFANTGNSNTALTVDPNYTKGLGSYGVASGTRFNSSVRIEYLDD